MQTGKSPFLRAFLQGADLKTLSDLTGRDAEAAIRAELNRPESPSSIDEFWAAVQADADATARKRQGA